MDTDIQIDKYSWDKVDKKETALEEQLKKFELILLEKLKKTI